MTSIQRLIKLVADAIAIGLVVSIIGGASTFILAISGITSVKNDIIEAKANEEFTLYDVTDDVKDISVNLTRASLSIKTGDKFSVYYGEGFKIKNKKGILYVEDTVKELIDITSSHTLIITVPKSKTFGKVSVSSGTGSIYIEKLICDKIDLDLGIGSTVIDYIKVNSKAKIDGGVGNMTVNKGVINDIDYSVGIGKSDITAKLTGKGDIEAGIGDVKLSLTGGEKLYTIKGETGIGAIRVGKDKLSDDSSVGSGKNIIDIDGGIGTVRVDFAA